MRDRVRHAIAWSWIILGLLGAAIAAYLTYKRYTGDPLNCLVGNGCEVVAASPYASVGPVPLSIFGGVFFLFLAVAAVGYLATGRRYMLYLGAWMTMPGALIAWWYEYVQFFILYAICIYCVTSAAAATLSLAGGVAVLHRHRRERRQQRLESAGQ